MFRLTATMLLAVGFVPITAADPPPGPRSDVADRTIQGLNAALDIGGPLFNAGDHQGCYRVYQGALLAVKPLLTTTPELNLRVQARLERAAGLTSPAQRAFELRSAIDEIRWAWRKPLWERLGGESPVTAVVHDFLIAAGPDPKVNFLRNGQFKLDGPAATVLERRLVEFISEVTGGPLKYTGRDMRTVHAGMKITDDEFNALAGHLVSTLKKARVSSSDIDELMGIIGQTRPHIVDVPSGGGPALPMKRTLWDRLGGEPAVKTVVRDFVVSAAPDPKVNFFRSGQFKLDAEGVARLERKLVEFVSAASGGPLKYTGKDMRAAHAGMKITDDEFNALAGHLAAALRKANVPQPEIDELMTAVGGTRRDIVGQ